MDSWTLQGDSYSFLRSAPSTFSLCHRDGTPNHIEIFDIINTPTQHSVISETTSLCDIFGDERESQSLSSSPATGTFAPSLREVDGTAAASPLVDDLNESSSSYHTAPGSSEGEEGFEDTREKFYSPTLQSEHTESKLTEDTVLDSKLSKVCEDGSPNLDPESKSPTLQQSSPSPSSQVLNSGEITPSSGHTSPHTVSTQGRLSALSYSLVEKRHSSSFLESELAEPKTESRLISPILKERHSSLSHQSLPSSPSFELTRDSLSLSESGNRELQKSPEARKLSLNQDNTPPEVTPEDFSQYLTESTFEARSIDSSPLPSPLGSQSLSQSRESLVCPEFRNRPSLSDIEASSPLSELGGRISLPDLLRRGSTPDIEELFNSPAFILNSFTPESLSTTFSEPADPNCAVSPFAPQYTASSPVILTALPTKLLKCAPSPQFDNTISSDLSSPALCCAPSSAKSGTSTPSPHPSPKPASPGVRIQVPSPRINYSLTPSPAISDNYSSTEYRHNSPSPEIRIITSEPEVNTEEVSSEIETTPPSPFLDPYSFSTAPISPTSSPHITGICYSVVQPEDRDSPPFPELSHLSAEEPDSTLESSVRRSLSGSRNSSQRSVALSNGTAQDSPHTVDLTNSEAESENTQSRHQRDSPQLKYLTPPPDVRQQSPSPGQFQISTPEQRSTHQSPAVSFSEQHSSLSFTTSYNPFCTSSVISAPEVEREFPSVAVIETQFQKLLDQNGESLKCIACDSDKPGNSDSQSSSPLVFNPSVSNSPTFEEKKVNSPQKQETVEKDLSKEDRVQDKSSPASFPEENLTFSGHICQAEETYSNSLPVIKSTSPNLIVLKERSPSDTAKSLSPSQSLEDLQSHFTPYSTPSESTSFLKPYYTPQISRKKLLTNYSQDNRTKTTEDMSRHVERRRTPSPPLTRFTPIHIIAPEKPYRHWQNSSHSHSQFVVPSQSGNSNKAETNRECPDVAPVDIYSQGHWAEPERQLEREQQLVQQRDVCRERQRERGMKKERKREEQFSEKREGWQSNASYRGEQVELSFSARNRKGPASSSAAPTNRESRQRLPTVHSHSESFLATRQPQQQQNLLRGGGASRRHQSHNKSSASGHLATKRPCRSSSSSMGSELDETDNEVKWFSDLAFRSLSSPEVDYLDMYSSSHRSSTNISQPSTQESPAGVKSPWLSYADFKGSTAKLDQDELSYQHSPAYNSNGLDPSRRYELGSFECVDVAVEREDARKVRRGVPKRQIQLKRRNAAEGIQDESSENSSPGIPVLAESPSQDSISRVTFLRQHSTPAVMQECCQSECSPERPQEIDIKSKLQKSASVDESCTKTKKASHLIKSVLSKKMQSFDKQSDEQGEEDICPKSEDDSPPTLNILQQDQKSQKQSEQNLSSNRQSDYNLSSGGLPLKAEPTAKDETKPPRGFFMRPSNRSSSSTSSRSINFSMTGSEEVESQNKNANLLRPEMRSELKVPFDSDHSGPVLRRVNDSKTHEREDGDTANASVRNTESSSVSGPNSTQARVTNKDQESKNTEDCKRQNIIPKAMENKKASLNVCLTPEAENQPETFSLPAAPIRENGEKTNSCKDEIAEDSDESNAIKAPLHKVRDVRRLVKNTYNLSFKAATMPPNVSEERTNIFNEERREVVRTCDDKGTRQEIKHEEKENEVWMKRKDPQREEVKTISPPVPKKRQSPSNPHPMQIQCKAVCWKEDKAKTSCFKRVLDNPGEQSPTFSNSVNEVSKESLNVPNYTKGDTSPISKHHDVNTAAETQTTTEIHKVGDNEDKPVLVKTERKATMLESLPKMLSKEREVSTAVVLIREGQCQTKCSTSQIQEEIPTIVEAPAVMPDLSSLGTGGHSVSMLLKEKGYQADIGAVVGENQNTVGVKEVPHKHVNHLEIPLQTNTLSCGSSTESHKEKTIVSGSPSGKTEIITKTKNGENQILVRLWKKKCPKRKY
ncbi:mucin-12 isoform X1 [Gouania willdenowi]|uniref:mucin-12 isoform X1 n=1 Tax=Gouania willdenowi TaxID=441366 RepID=UPI001055AEF0|nr:mucin-12-like isoform X1 [Gouania willdenowi]